MFGLLQRAHQSVRIESERKEKKITVNVKRRGHCLKEYLKSDKKQSSSVRCKLLKAFVAVVFIKVHYTAAVV